MRQYTLSPEAIADFDELWLFIASDNVAAANTVRDQILAALARLGEYPNAGHVREDLAPAALRFWPVGSYEIICRPETDPLEIVRILSGYRDLPRLLG
jgi:plasmid stabilization system protein ParE